MLIRTDPFRELDRLTQQVFRKPGHPARPSAMPMDAWQQDEEFIVEFDLLGVDPAWIDLDVERNVLTVRAERPALQGDGEATQDPDLPARRTAAPTHRRLTAKKKGRTQMR